MKDISKLSAYLDESLTKDLINEFKKAHRETAEKVYEDIVGSAPVRTGEYRNSIQISDTEEKDNIIETKIYSDLKVGGDDPRWANIPLANFINWGTGPLGENTNIFPHNYPYTTDEPWNAITWFQFRATGTWGMPANPHFYLSLESNKDYYLKKLREVVKSA